jgi:hypothetical protein
MDDLLAEVERLVGLGLTWPTAAALVAELEAENAWPTPTR